MGTFPFFAVYLAPAVFVFLNLVRTRSVSLHHISSLRNPSTRITLEEWLAAYRYLGLRLATRTHPPATKPTRRWRLIGSAAALAASLILYQFILPLNIPLSFAQHDWNAFPVIQVAIAGGALASSLMFAFHRARRWRLIERHGAEYPYLTWGRLRKTKGRIT